MRWRRVRLSVKQLMIVVAAAAVLMVAVRFHQQNVLLRSYMDRNPIAGTRVSFGLDPETYGEPHHHPTTVVQGDPISVRVDYLIALDDPKPPVRASIPVLVMIYLRDPETKLPIDSYTVLVPLAISGRDSVEGSFVWHARPERPGSYVLSYRVWYWNPDRDWFHVQGGTRGRPLTVLKAPDSDPLP